MAGIRCVGFARSTPETLHTFGNYPLLIRALAGEIAEYRLAPGYFDQWMADNPNFNPVISI